MSLRIVLDEMSLELATTRSRGEVLAPGYGPNQFGDDDEDSTEYYNGSMNITLCNIKFQLGFLDLLGHQRTKTYDVPLIFLGGQSHISLLRENNFKDLRPVLMKFVEDAFDFDRPITSFRIDRADSRSFETIRNDLSLSLIHFRMMINPDIWDCVWVYPPSNPSCRGSAEIMIRGVYLDALFYFTRFDYVALNE